MRRARLHEAEGGLDGRRPPPAGWFDALALGLVEGQVDRRAGCSAAAAGSAPRRPRRPAGRRVCGQAGVARQAWRARRRRRPVRCGCGMDEKSALIGGRAMSAPPAGTRPLKAGRVGAAASGRRRRRASRSRPRRRPWSAARSRSGRTPVAAMSRSCVELHAARDLEQRAAGGQRHRLAHARQVEVVQQHAGRAVVQRLAPAGPGSRPRSGCRRRRPARAPPPAPARCRRPRRCGSP